MMQRTNASSGSMPSKRRTKFFKLIHFGIIQEQQLELPSGFVKKHGNELPSVVTVTVPTGDSWTMRLKKAQGRFCFSGGWKDFVDHHSIHVGHVLFFSYYGHATFDVSICDMTSAEIDYPRKTEQSHEVPEKTTLQEKGKRYTEVGETSMRQGSKTMTHHWSGKAFHSNGSWVHKNSATEAGRKHKSDHPSFLIVMKPSYVEDGFALNVPAKFMRTYLRAESQIVTLRLPPGCSSQGREWMARCVFYNKNVVKFYDWKAFAEDNGLKIYDVCVFELKDLKTTDFTVSIYRNKQEVPYDDDHSTSFSS